MVELMGGMESDNFRWYKVLLMKEMASISHLINFPFANGLEPFNFLLAIISKNSQKKLGKSTELFCAQNYTQGVPKSR